MSEPNFQEWKRDNPHKSINEYYQKYPRAGVQKIHNIPTVKIEEESKDLSAPNEKRSIDIGTIIVSVMILIAFFLPWIDIKFFGIELVNITGFDLPKALDDLNQGSSISPYSIYIIPLCAFVALIGETQKSWITPLAEITAALLMLYWVWFLYHLISSSGFQFGIEVQPLKYLSFGLYLTAVGCSFYVYDTAQELMRVLK